MRKLLMALTAALMISASAYAEEAKIVVLDAQKIINDSNAAKGAVSKIEKARNDSQSKIDKMETDITKKREDLEKKRSVLSDEKFIAEESKLKADLRTYRAQVQNMQEQLNNQVMAYRREIIDVMRKEVEDMAEANGYSMVLERNQVMFSTPSLDITDEVMKRVNKRLSAE